MDKIIETDILVCGSGIIGLTIAKRLIDTGYKNILIIDKEENSGEHASGRNSGVLHSGIYYPNDTLKAQFTLQGNHLMKEYCIKNNLPICESGKVVVTNNDEEINTLNELYNRAKDNGAKVEIINKKKLKEIEPYAKTYKEALYVHDTTVVDPKKILLCLTNELVSSGKVKILYNTSFSSLNNDNVAKTSSGLIKFDIFINAAGAYGDKISHSFGIGLNYKIIPFKGIYKKLVHNKSSFVNGNIYPVPDINNPFLGIHLTKSINGDVYIGPTAIPAFGRENYDIIKGIDSEVFDILFREGVLFFSNKKFRNIALEEPKKYWFKYFFNDVQKLISDITPNDIEYSSKVGIRPQLVNWKNKELVMDFLIKKEGNSVHILNSISPAFTCSMAFSKFVVDNYIT
ncbi:MAG: L-2-hydroxyglutarate oxidase [Methyloprofundus sp.]|nr:L-2-hydroxyglutarate oxidase [Methyloprofundus sp.]